MAGSLGGGAELLKTLQAIRAKRSQSASALQTCSTVCSWLCANIAISISASSPPSDRKAPSPSTTAATSRKRCLSCPKLAINSASTLVVVTSREGAGAEGLPRLGCHEGERGASAASVRAGAGYSVVVLAARGARAGCGSTLPCPILRSSSLEGGSFTTPLNGHGPRQLHARACKCCRTAALATRAAGWVVLRPGRHPKGAARCPSLVR